MIILKKKNCFSFPIQIITRVHTCLQNNNNNNNDNDDKDNDNNNNINNNNDYNYKLVN